MSTIEVKGLDQWLARVDNMGKQARYALVQAINRTLKELQTDTVTRLLPEAFTLRSRGGAWQTPGNRWGFNIRPFASKASLTGVLGSQADWLKEQEAGGTKTAEGHRVAIVADARPDKTAVLPRALKPRRLLSTKKAGGFKLPLKGAGKFGIFVRAAGRLKLMHHVLQSSVNIKGRLHFEPEAAKFIGSRFEKNFNAEWTKALQSSK